MKLSNFRKGFTLVEIMIVVVIIGILATLAVPALKKARNSAVEKSLFNDARQISSAANQYFADKGATHVQLKDLIGSNSYISSLSSGTLVQAGGNKTSNLDGTTDLWSNTTAQTAFLATSNDTTYGANSSIVTLGNVGYRADLSGSDTIKNTDQGGYSGGDNFLSFAVETGTLLKKNATSPDTTAAYVKP